MVLRTRFVSSQVLIQLGSNCLKKDIDCIYFDDFDGGYKLTKYLLDCLEVCGLAVNIDVNLNMGRQVYFNYELGLVTNEKNDESISNFAPQSPASTYLKSKFQDLNLKF